MIPKKCSFLLADGGDIKQKITIHYRGGQEFDSETFQLQQKLYYLTNAIDFFKHVCKFLYFLLILLMSKVVSWEKNIWNNNTFLL